MTVIVSEVCKRSGLQGRLSDCDIAGLYEPGRQGLHAALAVRILTLKFGEYALA